MWLCGKTSHSLQVDVRGILDKIEKMDGKHFGYKKWRVAKPEQIKQTLEQQVKAPFGLEKKLAGGGCDVCVKAIWRRRKAFF